MDLVVVLFCSLVLSLLNLLQQVKITFHTCSLQFLVLGIRSYSANTTLDHDTLHDGANLEEQSTELDQRIPSKAIALLTSLDWILRMSA